LPHGLNFAHTQRNDLSANLWRACAAARRNSRYRSFPTPPPPPTFEERLAAVRKRPSRSSYTRLLRNRRGSQRHGHLEGFARYLSSRGLKTGLIPRRPLPTTLVISRPISSPENIRSSILSPGFESRFVTIELSRDAVQSGLNVKIEYAHRRGSRKVWLFAGAKPNH